MASITHLALAFKFIRHLCPTYSGCPGETWGSHRHNMAILGEERTGTIQGQSDRDNVFNSVEKVNSWKFRRFFDRRWRNDCALPYMPERQIAAPSDQAFVFGGRTRVFKYGLRDAAQEHVRNELEHGMDVGRLEQAFCQVNSRHYIRKFMVQSDRSKVSVESSSFKTDGTSLTLSVRLTFSHPI